MMIGNNVKKNVQKQEYQYLFMHILIMINISILIITVTGSMVKEKLLAIIKSVKNPATIPEIKSIGPGIKAVKAINSPSNNWMMPPFNDIAIHLPTAQYEPKPKITNKVLTNAVVLQYLIERKRYILISFLAFINNKLSVINTKKN